MNKSWYTYELVLAHTRMSHSTHMICICCSGDSLSEIQTHSFSWHDSFIHVPRTTHMTHTHTRSAFSAVVSIWKRYQNIHIVTSLMYTQPVLLLYMFAIYVCYICLLIYLLYMFAIYVCYICNGTCRYRYRCRCRCRWRCEYMYIHIHNKLISLIDLLLLMHRNLFCCQMHVDVHVCV